MKSSTINQIQKELSALEPKQVQEICMRLAKFKKDNKELLSYLLFDAIDEKSYIQNVKEEINKLFGEINRHTTYTTKKGLQKVVRNMNKFIQYSDKKQTEIELRIYFCLRVKANRIDLDSSNVISNLYYREKDKINVAFSKLHEDLQYDYKEDLEKL
jgi:vacuolar-type H+-ATPase catalytic subunit A/Vma1